MMRVLILSFFSVLLISSTGCDKEVEKVTVVRDCTGDYIRTKGGKDYYVCNEEIIENVSTGTKVKVKFDILEECFGLLDVPDCEMEHLYESKVEITELP